MRKFNVFNNIIYQKYEPTQSLIYSFVYYQFDIYFYVGSIDEESTEDMERKNFDLLQLIIPEIMRILLAFSYFPTYSDIWSPPNLPLQGQYTRVYSVQGQYTTMYTVQGQYNTVYSVEGQYNTVYSVQCQYNTLYSVQDQYNTVYSIQCQYNTMYSVQGQYNRV